MFNRIVPVLVGSAFVFSIGGLGGTLIWQRMPPLEFKVPDVILCALGLADVESACVQAEIGRIRDEAERIKRERDALSLAQEETERRRRELEEINDDVESFNLFSNIETGIGTINTGVEFASILTPEAWVNAWCYWSGPGTGAVSTRLDLGHKTPGQPVVWDDVTETELADLGLSVGELTEARLGCRFPED
jgi:hypothetical protein